ncbi:MAG: hypothetical protein FWC01_06650 [Treponema sp.]|nr:hypothetical protein [Treponema sp.]MCL2237601.1 hypothetical protein [Treponema sp.]
MKKLLPLCLVFSTLLSCAARINGSLASDGSASLSLNMALEPAMTSLIQRLNEAGSGASGPVLNGPGIASSFASAPGVTSATFRNLTSSSIEGQIRISAISEFFGTRRGFVTFEQRAQGGRCVINLNRTNGPEILGLISEEISDYLNALMAPVATGEEMTRPEYLDLVASFYNRNIRNEIASSRVRVSIDFPGAITAARGGTYSGRRANFDIPLLDLLVLENPLVYEVTWN